MRTSSLFFAATALISTGYSAAVPTPKEVAAEYALEAAVTSAFHHTARTSYAAPHPHRPPPQGKPAKSFPGFSKLKYLFSFGDSYTQTGFNLTNGSPLPSSSNPFGNPPYPGWTSSNGPNWIGYLTSTYNASVLQTYNNAYGGATISSELVAPWRDDVLSLGDQIEGLFVPHVDHSIWKPTDSLFLIWIGVNDIGNSYYNGDWDNFHNLLMDEYFRLVDVLYKQGARNFLFLDVPPIERSPGTTQWGDASVEQQRGALASFNGKLKERVAALKTGRNGVWAEVFESSKVFNEIIDTEPATRLEKYGISEVDEFCAAYQNGTPEWDTSLPECEAPVDQYFWLNSLHPGHLVHKWTAKALAEFLKGF